MHENTESRPRSAVLAAVDTDSYDVEVSLAELGELARSAGLEVAAEVVQKRGEIDRATCIGAGKLEEIARFLESSGADLILFDHELSATQIRNIEKACGAEVMDRTMLILDIFAQRARSHEGRLQVELARNRYLLPRLAGMGAELSRLGGGGGGAGAGARRGKGETKLELDRRRIRRSIRTLESQLRELEARRDRLWKRRKKDDVTTVVIVGYTNVGKSTLLDALTDAGVLAEDRLFATLDPTARALTLPDGRTVVLIDTVGLIRRLPHHLVEAFKSTLEVAAHADLLLNVCDLSGPDALEQARITEELLAELGVRDTPVLTVFNKADRAEHRPETNPANTAVISAKYRQGLDELLDKITRLLPPERRRMRLLIPYEAGSLIAEIRRDGSVLAEEYRGEGTYLDAMVDEKLVHKADAYRLEP